MLSGKLGKKRETIREVFLEAKERASNEDYIVFDNDLVKKCATMTGFKNPFDVVKHDTQKTLPDEMISEDYFIIHLGKGEHAFVRGANCGFSGFRSFENIPQKDRVIWPFRPSLMSRISESESQTISTVCNEGIIGDFLIGNKNSKVLFHAGRRSRATFNGEACPGINFSVKSVQLETDAFFEINEDKGVHPPILATVEAKKTNAVDFEVRQVYTAMRYLQSCKERGLIPTDTEIHSLYVVRDSPQKQTHKSWYHVRIYDYYFRDPVVMSSIRLRDRREYQLEPTTQDTEKDAQMKLE